MSVLDALCHGPDGLDLISPIDDAGVDGNAGKRLVEAVEEGETFEVFLGEEPADRARRVEASLFMLLV